MCLKHLQHVNGYISLQTTWWNLQTPDSKLYTHPLIFKHTKYSYLHSFSFSVLYYLERPWLKHTEQEVYFIFSINFILNKMKAMLFPGLLEKCKRLMAKHVYHDEF